MRSAAFVIAVLLGSGEVLARDIFLNVTNNSPLAISEITTSASNESPLPNPSLASGGVAPGTTVPIDFTLPDEQCVFDLTFKSSGRDDIVRPAVDLCQTEAIIIE